MMRKIYILAFIFVCLQTFGQKNQLKQVLSEQVNERTRMNEQIFLEKKTTLITEVQYLFDSTTGKYQRKYDTYYEYFPKERYIRRSYSSEYFNKYLMDYWITDSNGVNIAINYNAGVVSIKDTTNSIFYENGKIKSIYRKQLFYNSDSKIIKTTWDNINYPNSEGARQDCYYFYKGDSVIKTKCFYFQNFGLIPRTDTLEKVITTKNEVFIEGNCCGKYGTTYYYRRIRYSKGDMDIIENYRDNQLTGKTEIYYKAASN